MIFLGFLAAGLQSSPVAAPVSLESPCAPLGVIVSEIAQRSGVSMRAQAEASTEILFISKSSLPASESIARLCAATLGRLELSGGAWCTTLLDRHVEGTFKGLDVSGLPDELKGRLTRSFQSEPPPP